METIKFFISKIFIIIVVLAIFAFLYWMATLLVPFLPKTIRMYGQASATSTVPDTEFWLPTPGSLSLRPKYKEGSDRIEFEPYGDIVKGDWPSANSWNGQQVSYAQNQQVFDSARAGFSQPTAIRGLSLYAGARVFAGLMFTGEATENMFVGGKFPVYVMNPNGHIVGGGEARATKTKPTLGWQKFTVKMLTPIGFTGAHCTLIFQQGTPNGIRIVLPVNCN